MNMNHKLLFVCHVRVRAWMCGKVGGEWSGGWAVNEWCVNGVMIAMGREAGRERDGVE